MAREIAGGVASGATTGAMVGGPVGGIVGGILGGLSGYFDSKARKKEEKIIKSIRDYNLAINKYNRDAAEETASYLTTAVNTEARYKNQLDEMNVYARGARDPQSGGDLKQLIANATMRQMNNNLVIRDRDIQSARSEQEREFINLKSQAQLAGVDAQATASLYSGIASAGLALAKGRTT